MHAASDWTDTRAPHTGKAVLRALIWLLWQAVRLPLIALLLLLEPFVSLVLAGLGFLGILSAIVLKCSGDLPHFPFWGMVAFSVGCMLLLMAYHALIGLLSR